MVAVDSRHFRPTEADNLCGDASKAKDRLGWAPTTDLRKMINEMVNADLAEARIRVP